MGASADNELLQTWITGWTACRGYEPHDDGRTTSVLLTDQQNQTEHFLFEPDTERFLELAQETKQDPTRVLTVVTNRAQDLMDAAAPLHMRVTDRQQSLMSVDMHGQDVEDPRAPGDGLTLERTREGTCRRVTVHADGLLAARGSVSVVGDYAVYDRIVTEEGFRRRGLGSYVMRALTAGVLEDDVTTGLLMASADGRALYEFLGWRHLADVFVIRG
ncbi:N-acetyltransferase [Arthrobacter sp. NamB2]|uniref:GNAT family N-acetyltransferase n=1 Tax=Arthrobacter sp. NamB2 TaxID=2576035 RepID=UPI0010C9A619|nr:GNAT family N-acetyltransferase [Arthrobacter sp. NamB2]TKV26440.1 N-acetyltransferase [Arthrobacter sp. NamB2]